MDPNIIGSLISFATLLVTSILGYLATRGRQVEAELKELRDLQRRHLIALKHIFTLRSHMMNRGITPPKEPKGLYPETGPTGPRQEREAAT